MTTMRSTSSSRQHNLRVMRRASAWSVAIPAPSQARLVWWWVVGLTLVWVAMMWSVRPVAAQGYQLYVPVVATEGMGEAPGGSGGEPTECGLNDAELVVANLMITHEAQGRNNPVCDPILSQVARARARDMALRAYFSHTNPDGIGPNKLVRDAGYPLPDWYGDDQDSNNIESIGAGYGSPESAWQGWLGSSAHRTHVLATQQFYADQEAYGIGYYHNPDSPYGHYWVFLSAPAPEDGE